MKIFFFLILLSNIIFYLWEFNSVKKGVKTSTHETKQILLLSELPEKQREVDSIIAKTKEDLSLSVLPDENKASEHIENVAIATTEDQIILIPKEEGVKKELNPLAEKYSESESVEITGLLKNNENNQLDLLLSELPKKQREVDSIIAKSKEDLSLSVLPDENKASEHIENVAIATTEDQIILIPEKEVNPLAEKDRGSESVAVTELLKNNKLEKKFCYQMGPFADEKSLTHWIATNNMGKNSITTFNKERKVETGFLVYYPKAETYDESRQHIHLLKKKGITDFWLFRKGTLKGNISLGLFVKEKRALWLKNRFVKKGINVEIMTRYRVESEWYANILSDNEIRSNGVKFTNKLSFISSCDKI